ncbi:hypothetical protein KC19_11G059200 [Ceratodon purpureus]|uniref:Uncharacterized protein n=1 Tax=Ceratodon purpureus TaxID=3225 RepID=A0A8T0GBJ1_CERPU|nr:hypothetical protein KC19_11G059200 [Ceratodon purpureus]
MHKLRSGRTDGGAEACAGKRRSGAMACDGERSRSQSVDRRIGGSEDRESVATKGNRSTPHGDGVGGASIHRSIGRRIDDGSTIVAIAGPRHGHGHVRLGRVGPWPAMAPASAYPVASTRSVALFPSRGAAATVRCVYFIEYCMSIWVENSYGE